MRWNGLRRPRLAVLSVLVTAATAAVTAIAVTVPAGAASNLSLLVLPDQGESAIYSFASSATSSIDLTMYELKDTTLVNDLVAREKAGVNVRVILDRQHESYDSSAYSTLTKGAIKLPPWLSQNRPMAEMVRPSPQIVAGENQRVRKPAAMGRISSGPDKAIIMRPAATAPRPSMPTKRIGSRISSTTKA